MMEMFEAVFEAVMAELGLDGWWELFDSVDFGLVEVRVAEALGVADPYEVEEFAAWVDEMAEDL